MTYADGMQDAIRIAETLSDAEADSYWLHGAAQTETRDMTYTGAAGQSQMARHYQGQEGPLVMYIHGGGWVSGSIAINDRACHTLALASGSDVVSVSYRLAPAHPFPAGLEDCRAALKWLRAQNPDRQIVLSGASAGANLALALALDEPVAGLVLFYGVFDHNIQTDSHKQYGTGHGFSTQRLTEILDDYDPEHLRATDPRLCPMLATDAQLAALPPMALIAAELDVLRDDSVRLAARLAALDHPHTLHVEPGVTHGFINRGRHVPAADACLARAARFLKEVTQT